MSVNLPGTRPYWSPRDCDFCDESAGMLHEVSGVYRGRVYHAQVCGACHARHVEPGRGTPEERAHFNFVLGIYRTAMPLTPKVVTR